MITTTDFNHVGIAVADAHVLRDLLGALGAEDQGTVTLDAFGLTSTFVVVGGQRLEVLELHDPRERARALAGNGARLHHLALTVTDLEARMARLGDLGVRFQGPTGTEPISEPIAAAAASHAWTAPETTGGLMLQLTEPRTSGAR